MNERRPKRRVEEREGLRFGIDIDGTISQAPKHFKRLIDALLINGNQVYIITAREEARRAETGKLLARLGIRYSELIMRPPGWEGQVPAFKVHVVQEKQIHLTIDDDDENCLAILQQTEALAAHMLPIPEQPEAREAKEEVAAEMDREQG